MKLLGRHLVRNAALETLNELELLKIELNRIKKMLFNGHHDIQVESSIKVEEKPDGTRDGSH